jgi:hypothetical protein
MFSPLPIGRIVTIAPGTRQNVARDCGDVVPGIQLLCLNGQVVKLRDEAFAR